MSLGDAKKAPSPRDVQELMRRDFSVEVDPARVVLQRTRSAPSSEERPRFLRPAEAEAYTDLFADDDDNYVDESDDTASSVSTVIDRLHRSVSRRAPSAMHSFVSQIRYSLPFEASPAPVSTL